MDKINNYHGSEMEPRLLELRSMKIDPSHREHEADLIKSRWFDYSTLHPAQATYLYAHLYKEFTRKFCEAYIDIRTAADARAFIPDDIFMSRDMTSMWLARGAADTLGLPYEFALQFASDRALNRLFQYFPRPNQLYGEEFEIDLAAAWTDSLGRCIRYSRLPRYRASQFNGSLIQKRHGAFVINQIKQRPAPHTNLLARMFNEDILTPKMAADHFHEEVIDAASKVAVRLSGQS